MAQKVAQKYPWRHCADAPLHWCCAGGALAQMVAQVPSTAQRTWEVKILLKTALCLNRPLHGKPF